MARTSYKNEEKKIYLTSTYVYYGRVHIKMVLKYLDYELVHFIALQLLCNVA